MPASPPAWNWPMTDCGFRFGKGSGNFDWRNLGNLGRLMIVPLREVVSMTRCQGVSHVYAPGSARGVGCFDGAADAAVSAVSNASGEQRARWSMGIGQRRAGP